MKRRLFILSLVMVLAFGLIFTGCEQMTSDKEEKEVKATEAVEATEAETTAAETEAEATEAESPADEAMTLNIYSSRHYDVDKEVYEMFEAETGIKVNVVEGKGPELLERLMREKDQPQADLFLTVGAETIYPLKEEGLLDSFESETVSNNVPEAYRGDGWTGIMYRARIIAYDLEKTDPTTITSYDDLMKDDYKGKILVRSSSSSYNVALLASFIQLNGEDAAKEWATKVVENMARTPEGNDRDQAKAVIAGEGDLAIMNSYYLVRMLNSSDPEEAEVATKVGLIFPENTHINLSYAGLITGAQNRDSAVKFIEFLTTEPVQKLYAEQNGEFPINPAVERTEVQKSWGEFTPQVLDFEEFGKYTVPATMIFDEVSWE